MWLCRCFHVGVWFGSRVSNYPWLQNDIENTCGAAFQPAHFWNAITNVLSRFARGAFAFTICRGVLREDPQRCWTGWNRDADIENIVYAIIRLLLCNQEFMIKPEICDCFPWIHVLCVLKFNITKIRELIS